MYVNLVIRIYKYFVKTKDALILSFKDQFLIVSLTLLAQMMVNTNEVLHCTYSISYKANE